MDLYESAFKSTFSQPRKRAQVSFRGTQFKSNAEMQRQPILYGKIATDKTHRSHSNHGQISGGGSPWSELIWHPTEDSNSIYPMNVTISRLEGSGHTTTRITEPDPISHQSGLPSEQVVQYEGKPNFFWNNDEVLMTFGAKEATGELLPAELSYDDGWRVLTAGTVVRYDKHANNSTSLSQPSIAVTDHSEGGRGLKRVRV